MTCLRTLTLAPCVVILGALAACTSPGREAAWEKGETPPPAGAKTSTTGAANAALEEADGHWAKRDEKTALQAAISGWEKVLESDPNNAAVMVKLARAHYFLVDAHLAVEDAAEDVQKATYQKGVDYGEKALLILDPEFAKSMRAGGDFQDAIKNIGKEAMPAAYWYCTNLGRFAVLSGLSARLFYKDRIAAAMGRIRELDQMFFYAAADRYFGAFYAALPSIAGKDLPKSGKHFEEALKLAPEYLPTRVVKAQFLAVELDDEAMYKQLLNDVLAGADTDNPDIAPENRGAKRVAQKMLGKAEEIF